MIAAHYELLAVDRRRALRFSIFQGSDLRLCAGLPRMTGNHTGPVQTEIACIGSFFSTVRMIEVYETHNNGDRDSFLMSAFKAPVEWHLV